MRALNKINKAISKTPKTGSFLKGEAGSLTENDYRILARMCMSTLIEKSKRGELIDINNLIADYWFIEIKRLPAADLVNFVQKYAQCIDGQFNIPEIVDSLKKIAEKQNDK